jgi:dTDP-4-dehydrorhamnose reductase
MRSSTCSSVRWARLRRCQNWLSNSRVLYPVRSRCCEHSYNLWLGCSQHRNPCNISNELLLINKALRFLSPVRPYLCVEKPRGCDRLRVLILGARGMLGHTLCRVFATKFDTWASVRSSNQEQTAHFQSGVRFVSALDAQNLDSVERSLDLATPDAVVNCIGVIKQRPESNDPLESIAINALFPHRLASLCRKRDIRLLHVSTDCVFSGSRGNYTEDDQSDANDLYGRTKYLGEVSGQGCLTVRTSIIGRELGTQFGLLEWLRSMRGGTVRGYSNAVFSGLTTQSLAAIIATVLDRHTELEGLYQIASEPISKLDLLQMLNKELRLEVVIRPDETVVVDRSLNGSRFLARTGIHVPSWPEMVDQLAREELL